MSSRTPPPPKADQVEEQYGVNARLYAEVRAGAAEATGEDRESAEWDEVRAEIEPDGAQESAG